MNRRKLVFLLSWSTACSGPAQAASAAPLNPKSGWVVDYAAAECNAQREYQTATGAIFLALRPSPDGTTFELVLATRTDGPKFAEELKGSVDFGLGSRKAWLLHYGLNGPTKLDIAQFRISAEQMVQAKTATMVTFRVDHRPDIILALTAMPALLAGLEKCTLDLQEYWNVKGAVAPYSSKGPRGDVRTLFSADDYPTVALAHNQGGTTQYMLFIDETGKVAGCHLIKPSGAPILDGMGCRLLTARAKFSPATDKQGKPVRSTLVTPTITWALR